LLSCGCFLSLMWMFAPYVQMMRNHFQKFVDLAVRASHSDDAQALPEVMSTTQMHLEETLPKVVSATCVKLEATPFATNGCNCVCYRAELHASGTTVCVKVPRYLATPDTYGIFDQGGMLQVFRKEADGGKLLEELRMHATIEHKNIVKYLGVAFIPVCDVAVPKYVLMEFCSGGTLKAKKENEGPLSTETSLPIFVGLLNGLDYLQARSLAHRDIKPDNLLLNGEGEGLLGDLGSMRSFTSTMSRAGGAMAYLAPEVLLGGWPKGPAANSADLFSLAVSYMDVAGVHLLFNPGDSAVKAIKHAHGDGKSLVALLQVVWLPCEKRPSAATIRMALGFGSTVLKQEFA